ncbi:unnamed protein product [Musa acuminata subsp. burmannicoides]
MTLPARLCSASPRHAIFLIPTLHRLVSIHPSASMKAFWSSLVALREISNWRSKWATFDLQFLWSQSLQDQWSDLHNLHSSMRFYSSTHSFFLALCNRRR